MSSRKANKATGLDFNKLGRDKNRNEISHKKNKRNEKMIATVVDRGIESISNAVRYPPVFITLEGGL